MRFRMLTMTPKKIAEICGGTYYGDRDLATKEITGVVTDNRQVTEGGMFVAIKGAKVDGNRFVPAAYESGALCCMSEDEPGEQKKAYIQVKDCLQAIKDMAAYYRTICTLPIVGITGSVGKTSTKEMIASVLSQKYNVLKTEGNFNNEIGLPLTIFKIREQHEVAVLEMGISDFGEMTRLTAIACPDVCVITNIGWCHLENLKTRDGILKAKTEIFKSMNPDGTVILNGDDDKLITIKDVYEKKPVFFGIENKSGIYAENIVNNGLEGMTARICNVNTADNINDFDVHIPVAGIHMVYNSMAAAAVGAEFGLTSEQIADGIANMETIAGRNHIIRTDSLLILDDCYNANPVSMKSSIDVLASSKGRKVAILGDMFELGEEEKQLHYGVGEYFKNKNIDVLITVGELSKNIAAGVRTVSACDVHSYDTKDELEKDFSKLLKKGDNILVKASHGMQFTKIVDSLEKLEL